jgi:hypothetical protein
MPSSLFSFSQIPESKLVGPLIRGDFSEHLRFPPQWIPLLARPRTRLFRGNVLAYS